MLDELGMLFSYIEKPSASKDDYLRAIDEENCLGKRSGKTRRLTYRYLMELYSLDSKSVLFRTLRYFWARDEVGRPLLALLCAYARDPLFRSTAPYILKLPRRALMERPPLEDFIDSQEPGRFSKATLKSVAQNVSSSWTKSGHLNGRVKKVRAHPTPTPGSVSYALLLGYLTGARGQGLFRTEYIKLLDCPRDKAIELAEEASRKGWITFKRVGDVIEVLFPNLINQQEQEWLREQG
ncbi:hypothetical protein [Alloalcanivorax marinus]|uniref:hypothetical protein n=1 Tax=Alloalcanivorax marinus TaxID=1177169 RepID=UPI0021CFB755|nr:hypothetical protein [Alloalcanivorax marinus]